MTAIFSKIIPHLLCGFQYIHVNLEKITQVKIQDFLFLVVHCVLHFILFYIGHNHRMRFKQVSENTPILKVWVTAVKLLHSYVFSLWDTLAVEPKKLNRSSCGKDCKITGKEKPKNKNTFVITFKT